MAIDIKKLNGDYTNAKTRLNILNAPGGLKDKLAQIENDIADLKRDYFMKKYDRSVATDKTIQEQLEADMKSIQQKAKKLDDQLALGKKVIEEAQSKVNKKLEDLRKDPETKKKLDTILYKRYDRKKKKELEKKNQLTTIKQIVDSHPNVKKWLDGIEGYEHAIKKYNKTIAELSAKPILTPKETSELNEANTKLPVATQKLADRKKDLTDYFNANHPEIDIKILNDLHSYNNITRQIKGCDRSIANCDLAMNNLSIDRGNQPSSTPVTPNPNSLPATNGKPSWWRHPFKRFQYNRIQKQNQNQNQQTQPQQASNFKDTVKLSKDEYNADIVQEYLKDFDKGLHDAAKTTRKSDHGSR